MKMKLLVLVGSIGITYPALGIISGIESSSRDKFYYSTVMLEVSDDIQPSKICGETCAQAVCSGVVLAPDIILTAAHCVSVAVDRKTYPSGGPYVYSEVKDSGFSIARKHVMEIILHSDYNPETHNADLALIFLKGNLPEQIRPVSLPEQNFSVSEKDKIWIVGYGEHEVGGHQAPIEAAQRFAELAKDEIVPDDPFYWTHCKLNKTIAPGDSGGPMLVERNGHLVIIGIAVGGVPGDQCVSGFHAMIPPNVDWIENTIKSYRASLTRNPLSFDRPHSR